jgi:hypothetical protein
MQPKQPRKSPARASTSCPAFSSSHDFERQLAPFDHWGEEKENEESSPYFASEVNPPFDRHDIN